MNDKELMRVQTGEIAFLSGLPGSFLPLAECELPSNKTKAIVLASGPSSKNHDLSLIDPETTLTIAVNEEGHRNLEDHVPDFWIFSDEDFATRIYENGYRCHPKTQILIRLEAAKWLQEKEESLPENGGVFVWKPSCNYHFEDSNQLPIRRTTSLSALSFLVWNGFKDIFLSGVDCGYLKEESYYKDDDPKRSPPKFASKQSSLSVSSGVQISKQHVAMVNDFVQFKREMKRQDFNARIVQGCSWSPLDCWEKQRFEAWLDD